MISNANMFYININGVESYELTCIVKKDKIIIKKLVDENELEPIIKSINALHNLQIVFKENIISENKYMLIDATIIAKLNDKLLMILKFELC